MKWRSSLACCVAVGVVGLVLSAGACANGGGVDGGAGGGGGATAVTTGVQSGGTTSAQTSGNTSSAKSSAAAGMATGSSSDSSSASSTVSTGVGGPMCTDPGPGEPNDTKANAFNLGTIDDHDGSGKSVNGMLDETGTDVDWYRYHIDDVSGATVDPTRQLFGPGIRVCKYIACSDGNDPGVGCPSGTTADSQGGVDGCCWTGGQSVTIDFGCSTLGFGDDSLDIWVRVDHQGGAGCEAYKVDFHG